MPTASARQLPHDVFLVFWPSIFEPSLVAGHRCRAGRITNRVDRMEKFNKLIGEMLRNVCLDWVMIIIDRNDGLVIGLAFC